VKASDAKRLTFSQMDGVSARAILGWRYAEPYDFYNPEVSELASDLATFTDPDNHYYAASDEHGVLVAYFCLGREARVPGGEYAADGLDIGGGLHPDLTGSGFGAVAIRAALDFSLEQFAPGIFRATVAEFNKRALHMCEQVGFRPVRRFRRISDGKEFIMLELATRRMVLGLRS
jgi:[ribosomal protein S18]-alanine N-acetyltransferase